MEVFGNLNAKILIFSCSSILCSSLEDLKKPAQVSPWPLGCKTDMYHLLVLFQINILLLHIYLENLPRIACKDQRLCHKRPKQYGGHKI